MICVIWYIGRQKWKRERREGKVEEMMILVVEKEELSKKMMACVKKATQVVASLASCVVFSFLPLVLGDVDNRQPPTLAKRTRKDLPGLLHFILFFSRVLFSFPSSTLAWHLFFVSCRYLHDGGRTLEKTRGTRSDLHPLFLFSAAGLLV